MDPDPHQELSAGLQGKHHRHRAVADREVLDPECGGVVLEGDAGIYQRYSR